MSIKEVSSEITERGKETELPERLFYYNEDQQRELLGKMRSGEYKPAVGGDEKPRKFYVDGKEK